MKQIFQLCSLGLLLVQISACTAQGSDIAVNEKAAVSDSVLVIPANYQFPSTYHFLRMLQPPDAQIGEYVRRIFEDSEGNLWFGTNGEGVGRFDGKELVYYAANNGLSGSQITAIMEDADKNIWCATSGGVSRIGSVKKDAARQCSNITNFTMADGLMDNWVWSLYQDSKGTIWAGTLKGLCRFDGTKFISFALPATKADHPTSHLSTTRICTIIEEKSGKLWFGTDGGGAYSFDGKAFTNFTTGDGLCDNNITSILKDSKGNIWFTSMNGGLSTYDGKTFTNVNQETGIGNNEVWNIYEDKKGDIWFSSEGFGVYRYDGKTLTNFGEKEGLGIKAVQTIYEDSKGRLWIGGGGGLYRFDGKDTFFNVTRNGLTDGC